MARRTVSANSQDGRYLLAVAEFGCCTCATGGLCSEASTRDSPRRKRCLLCTVLDPEWPCPTLDEDADYPDPSRVFVDGGSS